MGLFLGSSGRGTNAPVIPNPPATTLFGAGINPHSETPQAALTRYTTNMGVAPQILRNYDGVNFTGGPGVGTPGTLLYTMQNMGLATIPQVGSLTKWALANLSAIAANTTDALGGKNTTIDSFLNSVSTVNGSLSPTSQVRLCLIHEADLSSKQTSLGGWSGYETVNSVFNARIAAHGDPNIIPIEIFTGTQPTTRIPAAGAAGVFSHGTQELWADCYQDTQDSYFGQHGTFETAANMISAWNSEINSYFAGSMKWGIGETGHDIANGATDADGAAFISGSTGFASMVGVCTGVCWYNYTQAFNYEIDGATTTKFPLSKAAYAAVM